MSTMNTVGRPTTPNKVESKPAAEVVERLAEHRILAGVPYSRLAPDAGMDDVLLVASTETTRDVDIQILAKALTKVIAAGSEA